MNFPELHTYYFPVSRIKKRYVLCRTKSEKSAVQPIGMVGCTAFVLIRTGGPQKPQDISWPSSPIETVSCSAFVLSYRKYRAARRRRRRRRRAGQGKIIQPTH